MDECQHCGHLVTEQYAKVFGDNDDQLRRCPNCTTGRDLTSGIGARPN